MSDNADFMDILKETSRTFLIPISRLPGKLRETIANAYLCMRAIDEIEDHPKLATEIKTNLFHSLEMLLASQVAGSEILYFKRSMDRIFKPYASILPEVSLRLADWLTGVPSEISARVWDATIALASRMKLWAEKCWKIENQEDLDGYTFSVAGSVGLMICDIWNWFDGSSINRENAVHFGRGLQAVNIIRNRQEDLERGVDFYPKGWDGNIMAGYASKNLRLARQGITEMPGNSFKYFVEIPLTLAEATLEALQQGKQKLSREQVMQIIDNIS
jgi:farnesyl-diphosphate farnesyltransferase